VSSTDATSASAGQRVALGTHVQVELVDEQGNAERLAFDIVADAAADLTGGFLGISTPLAQAIVGHSEGEMVVYQAADLQAVRVLKVMPAVNRPPADAQAEREAVIQKAVARSETLNDAAFAMAAGSKWGDYDPAATVSQVVPTAAKPEVKRRKKMGRP